MPQRVYCNVEDHRMIVNGKVVEDITSVELPTIEHPTTTISAAGMAGDVDFPNMSKVNSMELTVNHNNGVNARLLSSGSQLTMEFRTVRMRYNVDKAASGHEQVKYRFVCMHKSTTDGTVEAGNPIGSTEKYTVLKYEKIVNGWTDTVIDTMSGKLIFNRVDIRQTLDAYLQ